MDIRGTIGLGGVHSIILTVMRLYIPNAQRENQPGKVGSEFNLQRGEI